MNVKKNIYIYTNALHNVFFITIYTKLIYLCIFLFICTIKPSWCEWISLLALHDVFMLIYYKVIMSCCTKFFILSLSLSVNATRQEKYIFMQRERRRTISCITDPIQVIYSEGKASRLVSLACERYYINRWMCFNYPPINGATQPAQSASVLLVPPRPGGLPVCVFMWCKR